MESSNSFRWQVARILIYHSYVQIGCEGRDGAVEEALPQIYEFVNYINNKRKVAGYHGNPCIIDGSGGAYQSLLNLKGYTIQAGLLLFEKLIKCGWDLNDIQDNSESIIMPANPQYLENYRLIRIDMTRF